MNQPFDWLFMWLGLGVALAVVGLAIDGWDWLKQRLADRRTDAINRDGGVQR